MGAIVNSCVPIRLAILLFLPLLCASVSVYVANNGTDGPNCLHGSPNSPCKNLTLALQYIHNKSDSIVYIENGVYDLLPSLIGTMFQSVRNITIAGKGTVKIECHNEVNAGLTFLRSSDIHIHGIHFSGCGVVHNSTSRDFNNESALSLLPFNATLYFEGCVNVTLDSVHVTESLGIAVQFYTTTGTNMIINSNFSNNPNRSRAGQVIGGGVYIEFPYCQPGDTSCNNDASSVDINTISNSQYIINSNIFSNNIANSSKEQAIRFVLPYKTYHDAFGRGGGLSIFFKGKASGNSFSIANCTFENNRAVYGGGLYVEMQDNSYNNSVKLYNHNVFIDNSVDKGGGGMLVSYLFLSQLGVVNSSRVILEDVSFNGNTAGSGNGGGLSYSSTRQVNLDGSFPNTLSLINCKWISNTARAGSALDIRAFHPVTIGSFLAVSIINSTFYNNSVIYTSELGQPLGTGAMYVDEIPIEFSGFVIFENNYDGTALTAFHASIDFWENTTTKFQNNKGHNGGAIALYASSFIRLGPYTKFLFAENSVTNLGGAIYVEYLGAEAQITAQNCFIRYSNDTINPKHWKTYLKFSDNLVAGSSSNSIYSSSISPCLWGRAFGDVSKLLVDEVFCWNTEDEIHWDYGPNTTNETCKSQILTGVSSFSESSLPRYLNVTPGKLTPMNLTGKDDQGEDVTQNLILHAYSNSQGVSVHRDYQYISSNNIVLHRTGETDTVNITIDTVDQQNTLQTHLVVRFQDCPPGFILENGTCICIESFRGIVKCHPSIMTAELLRGFWIGRSPIDNTTVVAHCQYCSYNFKGGYLIMNESLEQVHQTICSSTREGPLCSNCTDGYAPAISTDNYKCVRCSSTIPGISIFILIDIIVPLLFLVGLYLLDVPLTNGLFHGPIFFAQMITTVISLDAEDIIPYGDLPGFNPSGPEVFEKIYTTLYDIFNLEFFMFTQNYCFSHNIRYATVVVIHYISALIPVIFVLIAWCIYRRPTERNPMCIRSCFRKFDIVNMLATFILLSYTKLAVITGYLLTYVSLIPASGDIAISKSVMYLDGSVIYMSSHYIPYLIVALIVTIFVLIPIPLFLMCFRSDDPENNAGFFNHLLDQFQRDFKNGPADFQPNNVHNNSGHNDLDNPEPNRCIMCCEEREGSGSWCDPYWCCFRIENRIEYEYTCCTPTKLYSYRQMESRYCCGFYTSCSLYDFRWLSGGFFFLRIILILPYMFAFTTIIRYALQFIICMISGILIIIIKPYKRDVYRYIDPNVVEASSLFLLALIITMSMYQYFYTVNSQSLSTWAYIFQSIAVLLPFMWIIVTYVVLMVKRLRKRCSSTVIEVPAHLQFNEERQRLLGQDVEMSNSSVHDDEVVRKPTAQSKSNV